MTSTDPEGTEARLEDEMPTSERVEALVRENPGFKAIATRALSDYRRHLVGVNTAGEVIRPDISTALAALDHMFELIGGDFEGYYRRDYHELNGEDGKPYEVSFFMSPTRNADHRSRDRLVVKAGERIRQVRFVFGRRERWSEGYSIDPERLISQDGFRIEAHEQLVLIPPGMQTTMYVNTNGIIINTGVDGTCIVLGTKYEGRERFTGTTPVELDREEGLSQWVNSINSSIDSWRTFPPLPLTPQSNPAVGEAK